MALSIPPGGGGGVDDVSSNSQYNFGYLVTTQKRLSHNFKLFFNFTFAVLLCLGTKTA